uniref:Uncharacterized protein n=1 Tax=Brassica oleracea TaxID=3712 RepID=A0A3P6BC78_BRAOL|nr:unnamed protein product [Brassica oleracea]
MIASPSSCCDWSCKLLYTLSGGTGMIDRIMALQSLWTSWVGSSTKQ